MKGLSFTRRPALPLFSNVQGQVKQMLARLDGEGEVDAVIEAVPYLLYPPALLQSLSNLQTWFPLQDPIEVGGDSVRSKQGNTSRDRGCGFGTGCWHELPRASCYNMCVVLHRSRRCISHTSTRFLHPSDCRQNLLRCCLRLTNFVPMALAAIAQEPINAAQR